MERLDGIRRVVVIDIDGLRRDVFEEAIRTGAVPQLARVMGGTDFERGLSNPVLSVAPSVTFACQASMFTGTHPLAHGVTGNELFDRLGMISGGEPRYFGFDVGDTLAIDDAVNVFRQGLAGRLVSADTPTLYERAAARGLRSTVVYQIYARGAQTWIRPELLDLARFTKGQGLFGLRAEDYDREMMDRTLAHLQDGGLPDVLTVYFMGLDHHSHVHGPAHQREWLVEHVDPQVGRLLDALAAQGAGAETLFAVVSDHGQIAVEPDDRHSLRIGFPFDREMGHLFDALGLDVHDYPGEDPDCGVVAACNGGSAHIYVHRGALDHTQHGPWADPPRFEEDVLPLARAFHAANETGRYSEDLRDALAVVLVRDGAGPDGWAAPYQVCRPDGALAPVDEYFASRPDLRAADAANRLRLLGGVNSGDLLLVSNYAGGYYFGGVHRGMHGGLHVEDSSAVQAFALPFAGIEAAGALRDRVHATLAARCARENSREPSIADLVPCVEDLMGW